MPCCAVQEDTTGAKAFKRVKDDEWLGKKGSWSNTYEDTFGARWGHAGAGAGAGATGCRQYLRTATEQQSGSNKVACLGLLMLGYGY